MKFNINAGEFKHLIEIQRKDGTYKNSDNIICDNWVTLFKTKAKILNVRGDEFILASGNGVKLSKTFYIRSKKDIQITEDDRIIYNNKTYNIKYSNDIEERGFYIEIKCEIQR